MPVVTVSGLGKMSGATSRNLYKSIISAVVEVGELELREKDIRVFFLLDMIRKEGRKEIIIVVDCLFDRPERTKAVRNDLAANLVRAVRDYFPEGLVECFVKRFNLAEESFWTSNPVIL